MNVSSRRDFAWRFVAGWKAGEFAAVKRFARQSPDRPTESTAGKPASYVAGRSTEPAQRDRKASYPRTTRLRKRSVLST